jgi:hypothetical protein
MARHRRRDYRAEYARRKALGEARGLSLPQARGHARPGEPGVRALTAGGTFAPVREATLARYYRVVARLAHGESLTAAARAERIAPRTVWRLNEGRHLLGKTYRPGAAGRPDRFAGYQVQYWARLPIRAADGTLRQHVPVDQHNASLLGRYWNAVQRALEGRVDALRPFAHVVIHDAHGARYRLLVDVNALYYFDRAMSDEEQAEFDRTFYSGREVVYVPAS